jgi:hypothetical protein
VIKLSGMAFRLLGNGCSLTAKSVYLDFAQAAVPERSRYVKEELFHHRPTVSL